MLKCSKNSAGTAELEEALATVLDIIKSVNDSMHQIAITGFEACKILFLLLNGTLNTVYTKVSMSLRGCTNGVLFMILFMHCHMAIHEPGLIASIWYLSYLG